MSSETLTLNRKADRTLPYDKAQFNMRIGYLNENDQFILNGQTLIAKIPFNVYGISDMVMHEREDQGFELESLELSDPVDWLMRYGYVETTELEEKQAPGAVVPNYLLYPYMPDYRDVLWVARVLQMQIEKYTCDDILLMAIYRETELNGKDIEQLILSRDYGTVQKALELIAETHIDQVKKFVAYKLHKLEAITR